MKNLLVLFSFCFFNFIGFAQLPDYDGEPPSQQYAYWQNKGQVIDLNGNQLNDFLYHTDKCFPDLYLAEDKIAFVFPVIDNDSTTNDTISRFDLVPTGEALLGAELAPSEQVSGYLNFILPHCVDNGVHNCSNVKGYNRVVYEGIYNGINLHTYSNTNGAKLYFEITPEGNPANINLRIDGIDSLHVYPYYLELYQESEIFELPAAFAYQVNEDNGIDGLRWVPILNKVDSITLAFDVGNYDTSKTLVLQIGVPNTSLDDYEPRQNMDWCTYYGGAVNSHSSFNDVAVDKYGASYMVGTSPTSAIPFTSGSYSNFNLGFTDIFISKFDSITQEWIFGTYFGGNHDDLVPQITVSDSSNPIVVFQARSDNLVTGNGNHPINAYIDPSHNVGTYDNFVAKFSSLGDELQWGTYYGGSGTENPMDIEFDTLTNSIYVVGFNSSEFPIVAKVGAYNSTNGDGYILKFDADLDVDWATKFGTSFTFLNRVVFDTLGNTFIAGSSPDGAPTVNPGGNAYYSGSTGGGGTDGDGYIIKLNDNDSLSWATYFGGSLSDAAKGITCDGKDIFVVGNTSSTDFPTQQFSTTAYFDNSLATGQSSTDAYFAKFLNDGRLVWSTYFGGTGNDNGNRVTVDKNGNVYFIGNAINGYTQTNNFPFFSSPSTYFSGKNNLFSADYIAAFKSDLKQVLTTCIYGNRDYRIHGIAAANTEYLYFAGGTKTNKNSFPLVDLGGIAYFDDNKINSNKTAPFAARFNVSYFSTLTGLSEIKTENESSFVLFPNPANQSVTIIGENLNQVFLLDATGKLIHQQQVFSSNTLIDTKNLSKGIYFIQVEGKNGISTQKLIIE